MEFVGILLFLSWLNYGSTQKPCIPRSVNGDTSRIVCVCNSTYCDEFPPLGTLNPYDVAVYTSSISGKRFERTTATFTNIPPFGLGGLLGGLTQLTVRLDDSKQYQKMTGFGCSLGESPAYHLFQSKLSNDSKKSLLHAFFGQEEYAKQGINFWGMTVQNEGFSTGLVGVSWAAMWMGPEMTSKFVRPDSIRVDLDIIGIQGVSIQGADLLKGDVDGVGFLTSSKQHVVVLQNRNNNTSYQLSIQDAGISGKEVKLTIEPNSFVTLVWNKI
uniref:Glycosyl hydrolase family 30 beta sandwich domain-containing protein n=1 Tax=Acrobeloides nanus TaxID=290746 RepID=A0A914EGU7_9BILA